MNLKILKMNLKILNEFENSENELKNASLIFRRFITSSTGPMDYVP
jgi:hypothetical protein